MRAALWMVIVSLAAWLTVGVWLDGRTKVAVLLGMSAPLVMTTGSWMLAERTYKRDPQAVTSLMIGGFLFKVVFFGLYVAATMTLLSPRPVPFVASFVVYFVGLYLTEALLLRRLFTGNRA
jgi:hypothetical protein